MSGNRSFDYTLDGGEKIDFYLCERPMPLIAPDGFHLGIKITRPENSRKYPNSFTLGFYPMCESSKRAGVFFAESEGAIWIPDPYLEKAITENKKSIF